jgi:uncharacterized protein DUF1353
MFRTTLEVAHIDREKWRLTRPLVWQGGWQFVVIRSGFETDFASIPKPVRWLLDNAGGNSEAAVLHDAVWRESKRPDSRVDPWLADGMFRRALRETGSPALTRGLMWFAVRLAATVSGRFGKKGPRLAIKLFQLLFVFLLGAVTALGPTIVAGAGLFVYWLGSWVAAIVWYVTFERRVFKGGTNWPWIPWPSHGKKPTEQPLHKDLLVIASFAKDRTTKDAPNPSAKEHAFAAKLAALLEAGGELTEAEIDEWLESEPAATSA